MLAELFEAGTYWELTAERVETERDGTGVWRVTLDVRARRVSADEVGVFRAAGDARPGEPP